MTTEPAPSSTTVLATWPPPGWADRIAVADGTVTHSWAPDTVLYALHAEGWIGVVELDVDLVQRDRLDVHGDDGALRVVRGEPLVVLDRLRLTLPQAEALARTLTSFVQRWENRAEFER